MTRRVRCAAVAALLAAVALGAVDSAEAIPILDPPDAEELVQQLAEARAVQGICYGWHVRVDDASGTYSGTEFGSSRGVGLSAEDRSCPRFLVFRADVRYTSESSEASDSAQFYVFGNVSGGPDDRDLSRVGVSSAALVGTNDDLALANAVLALPALVAERGLAPPVPTEAAEGTIPPTDRPTNRPGSDWTRAYGGFLLLSGVLIVGGLGWAGWAWAQDRFNFHRVTDT